MSGNFIVAVIGASYLNEHILRNQLCQVLIVVDFNSGYVLRMTTALVLLTPLYGFCLSALLSNSTQRELDLPEPVRH